MHRILIVDDDPLAAGKISTFAESLGFKTVVLLEAEFLFQMLENKVVDLILLDINMPDTGGISLLRSLKNHGEFQSIPVIMMVSNTEEVFLTECVELGVLDFINKPISKSRLKVRLMLASSLLDKVH